MSPVPQQRSRTRAPGRPRIEEKLRAVRRHHSLSTLADSRWLSRSYFGAMEENISRTARPADAASFAPSGAAPRTGPGLALVNFSITRCPPDFIQSRGDCAAGHILHDFNLADRARQDEVDHAVFCLLVGLNQSQGLAGLDCN